MKIKPLVTVFLLYLILLNTLHAQRIIKYFPAGNKAYERLGDTVRFYNGYGDCIRYHNIKTWDAWDIDDDQYLFSPSGLPQMETDDCSDCSNEYNWTMREEDYYRDTLGQVVKIFFCRDNYIDSITSVHYNAYAQPIDQGQKYNRFGCLTYKKDMDTYTKYFYNVHHLLMSAESFNIKSDSLISETCYEYDSMTRVSEIYTWNYPEKCYTFFEMRRYIGPQEQGTFKIPLMKCQYSNNIITVSSPYFRYSIGIERISNAEPITKYSLTDWQIQANKLIEIMSNKDKLPLDSVEFILDDYFNLDGKYKSKH